MSAGMVAVSVTKYMPEQLNPEHDPNSILKRGCGVVVASHNGGEVIESVFVLLSPCSIRDQ